MRHKTNGTAKAAAADSKAKLAAAQKLTPMYERMADRVAELPADEFAARVVKAFGHGRHA
jgi:hypothetical protein